MSGQTPGRKTRPGRRERPDGKRPGRRSPLVSRRGIGAAAVRLTTVAARRPLRVMAVFAGVMLVAAAVFRLAEQPANPDCRTIWDALWWVVVLVLSGFERFPVTIAGKLMGMLAVVAGAALISVFTGVVASALVEHRLKGVSVVHDFRNCVLICGWNARSRQIISEIHSDKETPTRPIVVLDLDVPAEPLPGDPHVAFVRGNPVQDSDLERAHVRECESVIVLGDRQSREPEAARDALSILVCLAVKSLNPSAYVTVEVLDPSNLIHFTRGHADEVICSTEIGGRMLAQAAINHGATLMFSELLTARYGNETYWVKPPESWVGRPFRDLLGASARADFIPVGVARTATDGKVIVHTNPSRDLVISNGDRIVIIAEKMPGTLPEPAVR